jgi:uncharacterized protein (TIGR02996 family)
MPMNHDEAFLQAIIENPDDDTPRLVYADYLDERGDPRAEFIRVQIALARLSDEYIRLQSGLALLPDDPRREELEAMERELLRDYGEKWAQPLRPWVTGWTFLRGFVEAVTVPPDAYLNRIADLRRRAPIRHVEVDLTSFAVAPSVVELVPESVAWANVVFPFGQQGRRLILAVRDTADAALCSRLELLGFILNREVEPVTAPADQIIEAINRHYNQGETGEVDSLLTQFTDTAIDFSELDQAGPPLKPTGSSQGLFLDDRGSGPFR